MKAVISLALSILTWPLAESAQGSPSMEDLISALKPNSLTRGTRPVGPTAEPPPPVAHVHPAVLPGQARPVPTTAPLQPQPQPQQTADLAATSMMIQFESGSDRLTPAATKELDKLDRALNA